MALDGEAIKETFYLIPKNPVSTVSGPTIPTNPFPGCCNDYTIKVLADASGLALNNDQSTVIWWFDPIVTAATLLLKKWVNGAWATQATISDNTYGTYSSYGTYVNTYGEKFISLKISWAAVLAAFGTGSYKVVCSFTATFFGASTLDSNEFCLNTYSALVADGTVRLEYWLSGTTGDITDDTKIKDFGTQNIYNSLRLRGYFGYPKSTYKEENVQYNDGARVFVEDEQEPVYKMELQMLPFFIHEILRTDFMMADTLAITDYNSKNNGSYVQKYVRKNSGYEPKWNEIQSNFASVELSFIQQINRLRKFRD